MDSAASAKKGGVLCGSLATGGFLKKNKAEKLKFILFSRGTRKEYFFTEDSKLYVTPKESELLKEGVILDREIKKWDSASSRVVRNYRKFRPQRNDYLYGALLRSRRKMENLRQGLLENSRHCLGRFSTAKLWNFSIITAVVIGMFAMSLIYRYLGPSASAIDSSNFSEDGNLKEIGGVYAENSEFSGGKDIVNRDEDRRKNFDDADIHYMEEFIGNLEKEEKAQLEKKLTSIVKGYPIEEMIPNIAEKDKIIAAFLIGIAKKESDWGNHVPVLDGQDCFNYWGYKQKRRLMGSDGHTCFNSRKDAVDTVAKRLEWLVNGEKLNTPEKMKIWKCGYDCSWDSQESVRKWISDVDYYFQKLNY